MELKSPTEFAKEKVQAVQEYTLLAAQSADRDGVFDPLHAWLVLVDDMAVCPAATLESDAGYLHVACFEGLLQLLQAFFNR